MAMLHKIGPFALLPASDQARVNRVLDREAKQAWESSRQAKRTKSGVPAIYAGAQLGDTSWLEQVPPKYVELSQRLARLGEDPATVAIVGLYARGKTGLACATVNFFCDGLGKLDPHSKPRPLGAHYTKAFRFFQDLKSSYGSAARETEAQVFNRYMDYDVLVIDEITVRSDRDWENVTLRQLIDDRANALKSTLILGNLSKADLPQYLGESVAVRINRMGGGAFEVPWGPLWVKGQPRPAIAK